MIGNKDFCYYMEPLLIESYETLGPKGYNQVAGGIGGLKPTPEVTAKRSASLLAHYAVPENRQRKVEIMNRPEVKERVGKKSAERIAAAQAAGIYVGPATGMRHTEETKKRIGEKASANATKQWSDPEAVGRVKESNKETWKDPELLARHAEIMREINLRPEILEATSARTTALWADPEWRAKTLASMAATRARKKAGKP